MARAYSIPILMKVVTISVCYKAHLSLHSPAQARAPTACCFNLPSSWCSGLLPLNMFGASLTPPPPLTPCPCLKHWCYHTWPVSCIFLQATANAIPSGTSGSELVTAPCPQPCLLHLLPASEGIQWTVPVEKSAHSLAQRGTLEKTSTAITPGSSSEAPLPATR